MLGKSKVFKRKRGHSQVQRGITNRITMGAKIQDETLRLVRQNRCASVAAGFHDLLDLVDLVHL